MAVTEQQFIDAYTSLTPEQQQKAYNAGNQQVKNWIDRYNASQSHNNTSSNSNYNNTPNTNNNSNYNNNNYNNNNYNNNNNNNNSNYQYGYGSPQQEGALRPGTYAYYNDNTSNRLDEIVNNLNNYWQSTPSLFNNYESFKRNFSYSARSDEQRKALDDWRYGYDKSRQLSTKSLGDLTTMYQNAQLTDADLNNLRTFYPDKYNQVMNQINAQSDMQQYSEMLYGAEGTMDTSNMFNQLGQQFLQNLLGNRNTSALDYFDQYQSEINSDEMHGWSDRLTDLQTEIDKIDTDLNNLYKDIEKRYEGTGASTAKIQAVYADEAYDLQVQRNSLALEQQSLATKYNSRLQEAQNNFNMRIQQHSLEMQERNQYMSELGFAMNLINFETNEQADERAFKNWTRQMDYQYGNIDSMDRTSRRKAVENAVSEILNQYDGIPMVRSKDQMVDDVLNLVDGGMKLGEALTQNIITPIQSKPEYQIRRNNKLGTSSIVTYGYDANGNPIITGGSTTKKSSSGEYSYDTIDLGNGYSVSVNPNKTININGQEYRITQLGGKTATSGIDFAPATAGTNQEVQAFIGGTVIRSGEDRNSDIGHGNNRYVEILGDNGYVYRYNHLKDWDGDVYGTGQRVEAGTVIGHMGETGHAYGVHLDLAVYDGSRANSMAVSPLDIRDQTRVFFDSVNAMGLGIGSVNTESTANGDWEDTYYAVQQQMIDKYGAQFMKSDDGKELLARAKKRIQGGWTGDEVLDSSRILTEDPVWQTNSGAYDAFERVFSKEYGTNQQKGYNFKDTVERWIGEGKYEKAFEYIADEGVNMFLTTDDKRTVTSTKEALQGLTDIQQLYQDYIDAGGKGWKFEWAENGIKYNFLGADNGKAQEIRTKLTIALNKFVKGMSGLTVSDKERKQYEQIFPKLGLTNKAFQGQIDNLLSYFENDVNTIYGNALGASTYQDLQDWYKENMGDYYSIVGHYSGGIYHNYQSHGRIEINRNNPTGSGSNTVTPIGNFVLYGIK